MTQEENDAIAEEIIRFQEENPDYWGDQDENGVDLGHLRENLKLTPAERLRKLDASRYIFDFGKDARTQNTLRRNDPLIS
jgi:hypothetical protein